MKAHPSGKPQHDRPTKSLGYYRPFTKGFVNERLNDPAKSFYPHAVGFLSPIEPVIWEDDVYARKRK